MRRRYLTCMVVVLIAMLGIAGCSSSEERYPNASKYVPGTQEITQRVKTIEVDYAEGTIELVPASSKAVTVKETANQDLDDDHKVHTWVDGSTLHVQFSAPKEGLSFSGITKNLTIELPEKVTLSEVNLRTGSANVSCGNVGIRKLSILGGSSDVKLDCSPRKASIEISSGDVQISSQDKISELKVVTSSGDLHAELGKCREAELLASSGDITLSAKEMSRLTSRVSSGTCTFSFEKEPRKAEIESSSGDIRVELPKKCNLTIKVGTASGDFVYDYPLEKKDEGTYVCGRGTHDMNIGTASGDISVVSARS